MTDPKDLRNDAEILPDDVYSWLHPKLMDAAAEIERLRAATQMPPPPGMFYCHPDDLPFWQRARELALAERANEQKAKPRVEHDAHSDTTGWFKR